MFFEIREQTLVREIERMRVFPIVLGDLVEALHDVVVVHFNGQFAAVVETAGREVDRAHDGAQTVGEQHLAVEFQVLELVNLDAHVVHDAQPADALDELLLLHECGGRAMTWIFTPRAPARTRRSMMTVSW